VALSAGRPGRFLWRDSYTCWWIAFLGDDAGSLEALEASTGRPFWHFNTGQGIRASPMTYAIDEVST